GRPARRSPNSNQRSNFYMTFYVGKQGRNVQIDFPTPNEYFDNSALNVLRQAFETYKKDDLSSDLVAHVRRQADEAPEAQRILFRLGLAYLLWWGEEQDQAVTELVKGTELVPSDQNLRLELASIQERRQDFDAALKVVESVKPLDHTLMQQRETAAL